MENLLVCPICGNRTLIPQKQETDILVTLAEWEKVTSKKLPKSVWDFYGSIDHKQRIYTCDNCGFSIFHPPTSGTLDFYNTITAKDYYTKEKWEHIQGIKDILKIKPGKLLDFGCGSGDFLEFLKEKAPEVKSIGFDYSSDAVKIAHSRGFNVKHGDFPESLNLLNDYKFDIITMFQVLEHLVNPEEIIRLSKGILKAKGFLIIGVPDRKSGLQHFPDSLDDIPPHHVSRWCEKVFHIGFPHLGFRPIRIAKEPLPDYLWEMYLPLMWEDGIWPKRFMKPATLFPQSTKGKRITSFIHLMKILRVKFLKGVPGHTIYALLQKVD
jgi:SAM-dependent methyltransferase